jgi:Calx-beta domain/Cellulase (glycosyl hydrolase family 5)
MKMTGAFPRRAGRGIALALLLGAALTELPAAHAAAYWTTNSIAFASAEYRVTQAQGSVRVAVSRTGDSSQAASIEFWSANGTAVAGRDYYSVRGTLSWAAGDSSPKTITLVVVKSPAFTGSRSFNLWLGWVSNATTGSQDTTQVLINGGGSTSSPATLKISGTPGTSVTAGSSYHFVPSSSAPAGATVAFSIANKPHWASFSTTNGALNGTPSASDVGTTPNIGISASDGSATSALPAFSLTVKAAAASPPPSGRIARPAYNSGHGFFVVGGRLYDPNGNEFRIRGVNRTHWDSNSEAGIALSGANAVRTFIDFSQPIANNLNLIQTQNIDQKEVPIVTFAGDSSGATSCSSDPSVLTRALSAWLSQAAQWSTLDRYLIINVANEWGPDDSTVWRDSYISAIGQLRQGGYLGPILIDSGGCGQDDADLLQYSQAVFNSDPQKNVVFSIHLYGTANDHSAAIARIARGNPTVITLASNAPTHPFAPSYNGSNNNYSGVSSYQISGVAGMTQVNGEQPAPPNVGGVPGAWTVTLSVDSSGWGPYSGGGTLIDDNGNYALRIARFAALSQVTGAAYIVGEFGPGRNIGPSPTTVTPAEIITASEANALGWLPWAWDDNDLPGCQADNNWFDMTYHCGVYTQPSDLTAYGQDVILDPSYGISVLAKRATIF